MKLHYQQLFGNETIIRGVLLDSLLRYTPFGWHNIDKNDKVRQFTIQIMLQTHTNIQTEKTLPNEANY